MTASTPAHCSDCKYFVPGQRVSTEPHDGSCHASPPGNYSTQRAPTGDDSPLTMLLATTVDVAYTGWPIVQASDWCGYYEGRPQPRTRKPKETST